MNKHRETTVRSLVALCLAAVMAVSILSVPADAATSGEIQKEIDALEEKNKAIQAQIDAVRSQYDANYNDMADIVNRKEAIDEEIALLTDKIERPTPRSPPTASSLRTPRTSWTPPRKSCAP